MLILFLFQHIASNVTEFFLLSNIISLNYINIISLNYISIIYLDYINIIRLDHSIDKNNYGCEQIFKNLLLLNNYYVKLNI